MKLDEGFITSNKKNKKVCHVMYQFSITTHLAIRCTSGLKDNRRKVIKQDTKQSAEGKEL